MSTAADHRLDTADATLVTTAVEVVIPVYNEERQLAASVRRVAEFLRTELPYDHRIVIVDNASTDATWSVARRLEEELPTVRALRLAEKGRGRALKAAWSASDATVVCYMDVDLSTDLRAFLRWWRRCSAATPTSRSAPGCTATAGYGAAPSGR